MAENQSPDDEAGNATPYSAPAPRDISDGPAMDEPVPRSHRAYTREPLRAPEPRTVVVTLLLGTAIVCFIVAATHYNWPIVAIGIICALAAAQILLFAVRGPHADAEYEFKERMAYPTHIPERVIKRLAPGERVYVITNDHPITKLHWMAAIVGIQVLTGWFVGATDILASGPGSGIVAGLWLAAMVVPVYKIVEWRRTVFIITNKSIILLTGVFSEQLGQMSLAALTDAKAITPFHSRWLAGLRWVKVKYGTFVLETAGQNQAINIVGMMEGIDTLAYILRSLVQGAEPYAEESDELPYPVDETDHPY